MKKAVLRQLHVKQFDRNCGLLVMYRCTMNRFYVLIAALALNPAILLAQSGEIQLDTIRREFNIAKQQAASKGAGSESAQGSVNDLIAKERALLAELGGDLGEDPASVPVGAKSHDIDPSELESFNAALSEDSRASADVESIIPAGSSPILDARRELVEEVEPGEIAPQPKRAAPSQPRPSGNEITQLREASRAFESKIASQITSLKNQNKKLSTDLGASRTEAQELRRQLEETRDRLILAETEVDRLSSFLRQHNASVLSKYSTAPANPRGSQAPVVNAASMSRAVQPPAEEALVATITVDKANLRTGPGQQHSPLLTVARGTRLTVEKRQGEWYRVVAPTGERAWISSEVVSFGSSTRSSPSRTVRVGGYKDAQ